MMKLLAVAVILLASAGITFGQAAGGGVPGPTTGGTVTGVTGTTPVVSSGGNAPAISCPTCGVTGSNLSQFASGGAINPASTGATTPGTVAATTISATGGITAIADGTHPGYETWVANTTNPSISANTFGILGPLASPTFTAYALQYPNAGPTVASVSCLAPLSGSVSALTFCPVTGSGGTIVESVAPTMTGLDTMGAVLAVGALSDSTPCFGVVTELDNGNAPAVRFCDSVSTIANDVKEGLFGGNLGYNNASGTIWLLNVATGSMTGPGGTTAILQGWPVVISTLSEAAYTQHVGTAFAVAGCGTSTVATGSGASGGQFTGGSATCTPVVTMGGSIAAPHHWTCHVNDQTTATAAFHETASTTTTVTFTALGVVGATDVIDFGCEAF